MSLINLSVKHGRSLEDARQQLDKTVQELTQRFGSFIQQVQWSPDRTGVKLTGSGVTCDARVDAQDVHVRVELPALLGMFSQQLVGNIKEIVNQNFTKQLPAK